MVSIGNVLAIACWLLWAAPLIPWLVRGFSSGDGIAQGLVAVAATVHVAKGLDLAAVARRLREPPRRSVLALGMAGVIPMVVVALGSSLQTVQALGVIASGHGLIGSFVTRRKWWTLAPYAALLVLSLPVTTFLDVIVGWPLRKGIAAIAAAVVGGVSTETVIRIEGSFAHVDLPCAGVRSLWAFAAVSLLMLVLRDRPIDRRFWWASIAGCGVLVVANTLRVIVLVALGDRLDLPMLAESVHQPLGVLGFAGALALSLHLTRVAPVVRDESAREPRAAAWLSLAVAAGLAVPAGVPTTARELVPIAAVPVPSAWQRMPAAAAEIAFATEHGASLTKARHPLSGASIVLVTSRSWLAHHVPEQCLRAAGYDVRDDAPVRVDGWTMRSAAVSRDRGEATAVWWFQSGSRTTDDLVVRIRAGLGSDAPWTLVSVLIPGRHRLTDPAIVSLLDEVRSTVAMQAKEERS